MIVGLAGREQLRYSANGDGGDESLARCFHMYELRLKQKSESGSSNTRYYEQTAMRCRLVFREKSDFIDGVGCEGFGGTVRREINLVNHGLGITQGQDDVWWGADGLGV